MFHHDVMKDVGPLPNDSRIAIATSHGRPYYHFSALLKGLGIRFDSVLPEQIRTYAGHLVLTTLSEYPAVQCDTPALFFEDVSDYEPAVVCGLMVRKIGMCCQSTSSLVVGIDPGQRSGLSISYCGQEIECSTHSSIESLVSKVISILGRLPARRRLVKIGDGDMQTANEIIRMLNLRFCSSFELELVNESRTSPKIKNFNCRGKRDILSARYISRRDGRHRNVLPLSLTG